MKKFISIIILAVLIFSFAGCAKTTEVYVDESKYWNTENYYSNVKLYINNNKLQAVSSDTDFINEKIRIGIKDSTEDEWVGAVDCNTNSEGHVKSSLNKAELSNNKVTINNFRVIPTLKYNHEYTIFIMNLQKDSDYSYFVGTFTYNGE